MPERTVSPAERTALIRTFVRDADMKLRAAREVAEAGVYDDTPSPLPQLTDALKTTERALQALKD